MSHPKQDDIKLYNKGKRTIFGIHDDVIDEATKQPKKFAFKPDDKAAFAPEKANQLRRLYPGEVVSLDDVKREFDDKPLVKTDIVTITLEESEEKVRQAAAKAVADYKAELEALAAGAGEEEEESEDAGEAESESEEEVEEEAPAPAKGRGKSKK